MMRAVADELIDIAAARAIVLDAVRPLPPECARLPEALGRVLAQDIESPGDLPPFDSSALDGYVVGDTSGGDLPVIGEARAGAPTGQPLHAGEAMRISTGAAVPEGGVAVIPVERSRSHDGRVVLPESSDGANIRRAGEDIRSGDLVIPAGRDLGPAEIGVLAALGHADVPVGGLPQVVVLTTGDELVEPDDGPLQPGQIRNSNAYSLSAQAQRCGAQVLAREIVRDTREATIEALTWALDLAEVVIVSGGVSVGPHDHVKAALAELGVEERFWRVALKPGKPTWFGVRGNQYVFGLPGNPVSAIVTFHLFARPALRRLASGDAHDTRTQAFLAEPVDARAHTRPGAALPPGGASRRLARRPDEEGAGVARADVDARRRGAGTRAARRGHACRRRAAGHRAVALREGTESMRKRDPRRLWRRSREAHARVHVVRHPETDSNEDGSVTSRNIADITVPVTDLERMWNSEYLERLARTYWRFLTRASLGLIQVHYSKDAREIVLLTKPFVLLRFFAPEYETNSDGGTVTWRINKGFLVAPQGRGKGFLRIAVERRDDPVIRGRDRAAGRVRGGELLPLARGLGLVEANRGRDLPHDAVHDPQHRHERVLPLAREARPRRIQGRPLPQLY